MRPMGDHVQGDSDRDPTNCKTCPDWLDNLGVCGLEDDLRPGQKLPCGRRPDPDLMKPVRDYDPFV